MILGLVVVTAICFDFTNGFHDTANAVATSNDRRAQAAPGGDHVGDPQRDRARDLSRLFGSSSAGGTIVMVLLAAGAAAVLFVLAQRNRIGAADLDRTHVTPEQEAHSPGAVAQPAAAAARGSTMTLLATPIVDTSALWKIMLASRAGGAGVVIVFGLLLLSLSRAAATRKRATDALNYALSGLAGLFCLAAVVLGIYAMTKKPSSAKPKPKSALVHSTTRLASTR